MRKLIIPCLLALAVESATPDQAIAQPVAPISATFSTQNLVDQLDVGRDVYNIALCKRLNVVGACNQNTVCAASFALTGQPSSGAACTANEAQAAQNAHTTGTLTITRGSWMSVRDARPL